MGKIKTVLSIVLISIFLTGCAGSPLVTSMQAETHKKEMVNLKPDMTPEEVIELMGQPDKTEMYKVKGDKPVLVYLYITKGKNRWTREWNESNYTPLVFENNRLAGWGWRYFNATAEKYEFIIKESY
jgi:outer membrane protein assembly factor BamE (lipoprotein component of BamABCDE complex)